uniref:Uncharacterized protein n=1 Tax=Mus musculus TaxID=10090 RepID=Q8CES5_MOUSE|nr:unnamed protein product [Mus musculus]
MSLNCTSKISQHGKPHGMYTTTKTCTKFVSKNRNSRLAYTVATSPFLQTPSWLRSATSPYSLASLFDRRSTKALTPQQIISTTKAKGRSPCPGEGAQIRLAHLCDRSTQSPWSP